MKIIMSKIVKLQRRDGSGLVTVPAEALKILGETDYFLCEVREENGEKILVYKPVRF